MGAHLKSKLAVASGEALLRLNEARLLRQHIEVLDHEFEGFWMKTAYRHPTHPVEPGAAVDPKEMVPVTDLLMPVVKSFALACT